MESLDTYLSQVTQKDTTQVVDALVHLAAFSDVRALTAIQNAFFHREPEVRAVAARAAGENLDEALLDALLSLLDDEDPDVRLSAVNALGEFAKKSQSEKIILTLLERQPEPQTAEAVKGIILWAGPGVIPILEAELTSLDEKRRERAIRLLPYLGDLGVMTLITNLPNLNVWESMQSAKMLGELDHPMLVDYFLDMLKDDEVEKRRFAIAAVGNGRITHKALQAVGEVLLNDPDQQMRFEAALYLEWAKHPAVLTYLDQFNAKKEKGQYGRWIREAVRDTRILIALQEKSLMQVLELLFVGEKHERPLACVELSRREDPIAIPFMTHALQTERSNDAKGHILVGLSDLEAVEAVDDILGFFNGSCTDTEDTLALRTLGELYHPKALDYLRYRASRPILNDTPSEVRPIEAARKAVRTIEERMGFLKKAWFTVVDEKDEKRRLFAMLLAMRGDKRGIDLMMDKFKDTQHKVIQYQTLRALGESGSALVLPFLLDALKSPDERMIWHAVLAIGQLPLEKAPAELAALTVDESPLVRMAVVFALGHLKDETKLPFLLGRLEDPDATVRAVALQSLGGFAFRIEWLPYLDKAVADESTWVRLEAARILRQKLTIPSRKGLIRMLRDDHHDIRFLATQIAPYFLEEDLRPALESCVAKGSFAKRNANQLLDRLYWRQWADNPELLAQKKKDAEEKKRAEKRQKRLRSVRKRALKVLEALKAEGWQSLMVTQVVGASYVDWETLYAPLRPGERLALQRELDNPHDARAIAVLDGEGHKLGYIPSGENHKLARIMDEESPAAVVLLKVERYGRVHMLHVEVFVRDEDHEPAIG
ncbi:MAG: HEAT repeat domain-containing protein [Chloroflexota bacterium]|nr:HEAT repeat domain-containing protein [Chloroflexota bacterium]